MARTYRLERTQLIPQPLPEVFAFFADASNLEIITPEFLHFRILTPLPIRIETGTRIDYRLKLFGVPFSWHTRIETFEPQQRFIDMQLAGPYRRWYHLHEFAAVAGGTSMRDVVDYELPLGPFNMIVSTIFVRQTLDRIFAYRRDRIAEIFAAEKKDSRSSD